MESLVISATPRIGFIENILNPYIRFVIQILIAIFLIVIFYGISRRLSEIITRFIITKESISYETKNLVSDVFFYILFTILFTLAFRAVGFNLIAISGGLMFAIGYASQDILKNALAGIMILTTKEIRIGDLIQVNYINPMFGKVEEINLRYTVLRANADMRRFIIPNSIINTHLVQTYTNEELVRFDVSFLAQRTIPHKLLEQMIIPAIHTIPRIQEHEYTKLVQEEVTPHGQVYRLFCYVKPTCGIPRPMIYTELYKIMHQTMQKSGIDILSYQHKSLTVDKNDKPVLETMYFLFKKYFSIQVT